MNARAFGPVRSRFMARVKVLFRCIGEAVCAQGLRGLAGIVPFGEVVYDVAREALERFRQYQGEEELREALQEAVQAAVQEVKEEARAVAHEVAAGSGRGRRWGA
jgi:hypothetical protein